MRKPLSILVLSILFLLSPPAILIFNAAINMVPLFGYGSIFHRLGLQDFFILALYPLAALSIFSIRKWGWWLLILSAALMILYNFTALYFNPFASALVVLLMNVILFSVALFFFRKHLIAPYFNPRLRWWEQDRRYDIDIYLNFPQFNRNVIISDISAGGCYVFADFPLEQGDEKAVVIVCGSFRIALTARVMRITDETEKYYGCGLMFLKTETVEREGLDTLLGILKSYSPQKWNTSGEEDHREFERYRVPGEFLIEKEGDRLPVLISDISTSGCSFRSDLQMPIGDLCYLVLQGGGNGLAIKASVVWKKESEEMTRYGLKFAGTGRAEKQVLRNLISEARDLGARERETDLDDYYRQCDESALQTPYRFIEKIKRLAARR